MNMKRRKLLYCGLLAFCMAVMMIFSIVPADVVCADTSSNEKMCEVEINVAPKEATVTFYEGNEADKPLDESQVREVGITDAGYRQYILTVPEGRYSYRAVEGDKNLGGMTFDLPVEDEIIADPSDPTGGRPSGEGQILYLNRVNFCAKSSNIKELGAYSVHAIPAGMPEVICGEQYFNASNNVVTPMMVLARGNALVYTINFDIHGELGDQYAIPQLPNETYVKKTTTTSKDIYLSSTVMHTITAPKDAKAQVFNQLNNFNVAGIKAKKSEDNGDGTVTHSFITSGGANLTYRVSMDGKITRAGYFGREPESVIVTYDETENPKTLENNALSSENLQARMESSTLVNVNGQNNLKLDVGDTFRLRSLRAAWQIINTDTQNIMIEPDFHYEIISGAEHIEMTPVTDKCTGNAGYGENGNWMDIKGVSEGTAIIEVSYDAIQIGGDGTSFDGLYGATNPQRKSLVVINVGETVNTLQMRAEGDDWVWDTEYDTVYFVEDTGSMTFIATLGSDAPDKVELSVDKGATWKEVSLTDGKYTAKGLVPGNNILKFTKGEKVEYQVVRGAKVTYTITNKTHDFEGVYVEGDEIELKFDGLFIPIPKISGIYNPGYGTMNAHRITYNQAEGVTQDPRGEQYTFITKHESTITLNKSGDLVLGDGSITFGVMGVADPLGGHRLLTDTGVGVNFSAVGTLHERSILPTIELHVQEKKPVPVTVITNVENAEITFINGKGEKITSGTNNFELGYGSYNYVILAPGHVREEGSIRVTPTDDSIELKINLKPADEYTWDGISIEEASFVDGVCQITNANQFAWFAQQVNEGTGSAWDAKLLHDISLGEKNPWTPIKDYAGTFDGNGHFITDLYINVNDQDYQALFGNILSGAAIKNLAVDGTVVAGVYNKGTVYYTGGIVASAEQETVIENCINFVDVSGRMSVGGIIGRMGTKSSIKNCYNWGNISGNTNVGGILGAGYFESGAVRNIKIRECYNAGKVNGWAKDAAITYAESGIYPRNTYYLEDSCATSASVQIGTSVTSSELKSLAETLGDGYYTGVEEYNSGYPVLTWEGGRILPYVAEDAIADIESYKNPADYRDAQKSELSAAIETAKTAISSAKTVADVNQAAADAKAVMDLIKTDAQLKAEEANKPADTPTQTPTDKPEEQPTEKPVETPTVPTELTAPAKVKVSNVAKSGKVKVTWKKVEGAAKYQVYRATKKNGKYTLVKTVATTSYTDSSTKVGKSFYFKVKADSADKNVKASAFSKAVKGTVVLKAPVMTAKSKTKKQVKLTWKKVSGAKKYEVYRATSKNGKYKKIATTAKLGYTNKKLKSGKTYYYKVKAIGKKKAYNSAFSTVKKCKVK